MEGTQIDYSKQGVRSVQKKTSTLKYETTQFHPAQAIQKNFDKNQKRTRLQLANVLYGSALPMTIRMEEETLSQFHRLPGLPCVNFGLDALSGDADMLKVEDYMGLPEQNPDAPEVNMHRVMEKKLKITPRHSPF